MLGTDYDSVVEGADVAILWDFSINPNWKIQAYRPDIISKDRKEKNALIGMNVPSDKYTSVSMFSFLNKVYKNRWKWKY